MWARVAHDPIGVTSPLTKQNQYSVPSWDIDYLGEDGMKLNGVPMPGNVLVRNDTLFACIFIDGDSVGCRKIARPPQEQSRRLARGLVHKYIIPLEKLLTDVKRPAHVRVFPFPLPGMLN